MLKTKDDIIAQKSKLHPIPSTDEKTKKTNLLQSPKLVYYSLLITLFLSGVFWLYTDYLSQARLPSLPNWNISFWQTFFSSNNQPDLDSFLKKRLDLSNGLWSFYIQANQFQYLKNQAQFNQPISDIISLSQQLTSPPSFVAGLLPEGLKINEIYEQIGDSFHLYLYITTPTNKQLFIFTKVSSATDISRAITQIKTAVPDLYWLLVKLD